MELEQSESRTYHRQTEQEPIRIGHEKETYARTKPKEKSEQQVRQPTDKDGCTHHDVMIGVWMIVKGKNKEK